MKSNVFSSLIIITGLAVAIIVFYKSLINIKSHDDEVNSLIATEKIVRIKHILKNSYDLINLFQKVYNDNPDMNYQEFQYLVSDKIFTTDLVFVGIASNILNSERAKLEKSMREEGFQDFKVKTDIDESAPDSMRNLFITTYTNPIFPQFPGLDINAPTLGYPEEVAEIIASKNVVPTPRKFSFSSPTDLLGANRLYLAGPILNQTSSGENLIGIIFGLVNLAQLDDSEVSQQKIIEFTTYITLQHKDSQHLLYPTDRSINDINLDEITAQCFTENQELSGRNLLIQVCAPEMSLFSYDYRDAWISSFLVILLSLVIFIFYKKLLNETLKIRNSKSALSKSNLRYHELLNTAHTSIWNIDKNGIITDWNSYSEDLTGYKEEEMVGTSVTNKLNPDIKDYVMGMIKKTIRDNETTEMEIPIITKNGLKKTLLVNCSPRRDLEGNFIGLVGVSHDITARKLAEKKSIVLARELRSLIDTANAPIFGIDTLGNINKWNQCIETISGFTKEEVLGLNLVEHFITDDFKKSLQDLFQRALNGENCSNVDLLLYTKTGNQIILIINISARRDDDQNINGVLCVGQDITERRKTEMQLIQTSKLATLGEMSTGVAHELNQPLNVIRLATSNVLRKLNKDKMDKDYLISKMHRIAQQTERAAKIIDHMRMFGRKTDNEFHPIHANSAVQGATDLIGEQIKLSSIELILNLDPENPLVLGNTIQLEQVILNLISNARDAILSSKKQNKQIFLSVSHDEKDVKISIQDTGTGFEDVDTNKIFEPFYTTKGVGKGTGLGLSVSYGLIKDMNGNITAENQYDGALFIITLPLYKDVHHEETSVI